MSIKPDDEPDDLPEEPPDLSLQPSITTIWGQIGEAMAKAKDSEWTSGKKAKVTSAALAAFLAGGIAAEETVRHKRKRGKSD